MRIALHGATGRMGQAIVRLVQEKHEDQIVGAIAAPDAIEQGRDVGEVAGIDPDAGPFFRDVLDHLNQAAEAVDTLDSLLSTAFDAHVARIQMQQNDDMRKISAGAALVVVPTLIAGVYGMNFTHMPELDWAYGYPFALALMGGVSGVLWWFFRRSGWL